MGERNTQDMQRQKPNQDKIVVFTGSGVSAPSGLATFRDPDGIWSRYNIEEVATPQAWQDNPARVLNFYNERRVQLGTVQPNAAHTSLAELETEYQVVIITQNVDDLHERAGSSTVYHLHGELTKVRSTGTTPAIYDVGYSKVHPGDTCEAGYQLRPHVVWFGESIFCTEEALHHFQSCDILIIAGTSLTVHPAAGLALQTPSRSEKYLIDLNAINAPTGFTLLQGSADHILPKLVKKLKGC